MKKLTLSTAFAMFCLAVPAFGNIAPPSVIEGRTLSPTNEEPDVQMVDEHVNLILGMRNCAVDVTFHLKNTGKAKSLEIGYPFNYDGELHDFKALVNGKPVKVSEGSRSAGHTVYLLYWKESRWKLWKTNLGKHQMQTVRVMYNVTPERNAPRMSGHRYPREMSFPSWSVTLKYDCLVPETTPLYPEESHPQYWDERSLRGTAYDVETGYILKSGQPWKGRIERSVIDVDWQSMSDWQPEVMEPKDASLVVKPGHSHWDMRNFEPTADVRIKLEHRVSKADIARGYLENGLQHLRDHRYCAVVAKTLIAYGDFAGAVDLARKSLDAWTRESALTRKKFGNNNRYDNGDVQLVDFLQQVYAEKGDTEQLARYKVFKQHILDTLPADCEKRR